MENTDFVIEHIDEEVQVIADQPSVVTNYPANTDFFIENIDSNVISIAHSLNIEASEVDFRPANTDFFIENIDKNVIAIAESMSLSPSEVDFRPANTDFFVENIDKNLIEIAESLSLTPYEVTIRPANTDMFIENIDKNVTLIKGSTNVVTVSGEYININIPDGGKVQSAEIDGNATQTGTPTPDAPVPISVVTGENVVKVTGKNLFNITPRKTGNGYYNNNTGVYVDNSYDDSLVTYETTEDGVTATILTAWKGLFFTSAPLQAGTQYHYKWDVTSTGNVGASVYTLDSSFIIQRRIGNYTTNPTSSNANITLQDGEMYIGLWIGSNNANDVVTISQPQIELGNQATPYQAYTEQEFPIDLGSIELAKIGTYQDRIYKEDSKWYVEKQLGKLTWNGSENWLIANSGTESFYYVLRQLNLDLTSNVTTLMSNYGSYGSIGNTGTSQGMMVFTANNNEIRIRYGSEMAIADWKAKLTSLNMVFYYPLPTPTTTEITNQTLIDQLETLASATLNQGVNNIFTEIETGNAMPTLKLVIEKY